MDKQYLCFHLNDEYFVHSVSNIREVMPYLGPTPVPGSPDIVEGVLNIRGNVVSIISAQKSFNLIKTKHLWIHALSFLTASQTSMDCQWMLLMK
ncbi:chemotaxis protein CheW [Zooshikella ganghwensis]|uniref:chemotaxis protein CheW n=1 Tax=Zooshikella ganghwensis TaxID=202772 RepID=UPI001F29B0EE|nr:chemotaxis protein CheW [Zooshikella ganghwensis]